MDLAARRQCTPPSPSQLPLHLPNLCLSRTRRLGCCLWAHRTLTRLPALCWACTSAKRPSLSSSLPGWHQTEKSKHRGSREAQHPLSTQRLRPQALRVPRLGALGCWVTLQEATVTGQLSRSTVMPDKWQNFRGGSYRVFKIKVWPKNRLAPREPAVEGARCAGGKSPGMGL